MGLGVGWEVQPGGCSWAVKPASAQGPGPSFPSCPFLWLVTGERTVTSAPTKMPSCQGPQGRVVSSAHAWLPWPCGGGTSWMPSRRGNVGEPGVWGAHLRERRLVPNKCPARRCLFLYASDSSMPLLGCD